VALPKDDSVSTIDAAVLAAIGAIANAPEPRFILPEMPPRRSQLPKVGVSGFVEIPAKLTKVLLPAPKAPANSPAPMIDATPSASAPKELGFYVGAGIYFVQPTWEGNVAFTRLTTIPPVGLGQTIQNAQSTDFRFNTFVAPRLFAGYDNECGLGVRVSWWRFDQSAEHSFEVPFVAGATTVVSGAGNVPGTSSNFSPVNGFLLNDGEKDVLAFRNRLVFDVWDFDVSQRFGDDCWSLTVGAGIRYAYIEQTYDGIATRANQQFPAAPGGVINSREVHIRNLVNLAGPDLFLDGKRSIGNHGLAVYGNVRGGYLIGHGSYTQSSSSTIAPPALGFIPVRSDQIDRNRAGLPFLEAELGLEWHGRAIGRVQPFVRVGIVSQSWFGLGNARSASGNSNTLENFGFFGGTFLGGVSF
jgi:hypothetical protein